MTHRHLPAYFQSPVDYLLYPIISKFYANSSEYYLEKITVYYV